MLSTEEIYLAACYDPNWADYLTQLQKEDEVTAHRAWFVLNNCLVSNKCFVCGKLIAFGDWDFKINGGWKPIHKTCK